MEHNLLLNYSDNGWIIMVGMIERAKKSHSIELKILSLLALWVLQEVVEVKLHKDFKDISIL